MMRILLAVLLVFAASQANAYCIYNDTDREVSVVQEKHPNAMRDERKLNRVLGARSHVCCEFHKLDCNPEGRKNAVVSLEVRILGEPPWVCGYPSGTEPNVKVTGAGTIRILPNPRKSAFPYVVRVRTHDRKDLTGPHGLACTEPKEKSQPKGKK
jgi:hypothetical protein